MYFVSYMVLASVMYLYVIFCIKYMYTYIDVAQCS